MPRKVEGKVDIIAVSKRAKVSASTVSRSFNHPELVKPATRKRIDAAVRQLGYIRNRAAQTIHGIRSGTIGLIVPTVDQAIFAELIQSFSAAVEDMGFTILLASHGYSLEREYALARKMLEHRVDGLCLIGVEHADDTFALIAQQNVPALLLWNHTHDTPLPCIGADNFRAGYLVGQHIAELGHTDIAAIFPPRFGNDRAARRLDGVMQALTDAGRHIKADWMYETPYSVAAAKTAVDQLIRAPKPPTAILCGNDVLAWGALHALSRAGIKVPDQISVTGIGDFNGSRDFEPALTTVRIPARTIGASAAKGIVALIKSEGQADVTEQIEPELIIRDTTA